MNLSTPTNTSPFSDGDRTNGVALEPTGTFCVMFDGSCPLCTREISIYRSAKALEPIEWVDVSLEANCTPQERQTLMARFHVRNSSGNMLSGAAAFVALWECMPGWRWLARLIKTLRLTAILEFFYLRFLVIRPKIQKLVVSANTDHLPKDLIADIRSDHAGETGAVYIYKGILAVTKDPAIIAFATQHLRTEQEHLRQINMMLPALRRSLLLPGWKIAGFLTGALPALFGANAVFATIEAVETFVDQHYEYQIKALENRAEYTKIKEQFLAFQADENMHRTEAQESQSRYPGRALRLWCSVVRHGSSIAVNFAKWV